MDEYKDLTDELSQTLTAMVQDREPWKKVWTDITDFVLPRRAGVDAPGSINPQQVEPSNKRIDSTATEAANMLADGLMGYTVSPAYPWFRLALQNSKNKSRAIRIYLDGCEEAMYAALAQSSFYSTVPEVFADGTTIGTATLYIDEDLVNEGLRFIAVHPFEIFINEDAQGNVTEVFRVFTMTDRQAKAQFGAEKFDSSEVQPSQRRSIVHAVIPNTGIPGVYEEMPWASIYYEKDTANILEISGFYEDPYTVWRYRKNTGETYGRSPAYDALPDILTLNQVTKAMARGVQRAADPPVNAPMRLKGRLHLEPNGVNYYMNPDEIVSPVQYQSNYALTKDYHAMLKEGVKKAFRADIFMSLDAATRQMTAEEVMQRQGEKAAVLGAIVGRLGAELLNPIIQRVFGILSRAGRLPEPPEELAGEVIKVDYNGPLFQAQKRYYQTNGLSQALQSTLPLAQFDQGVLDIINFDGVARKMIESSGMPAEAYRDAREVDQVRKQRAEAQEAQQQAMIQMEQTKALGAGMTKTIEQGSPLDRMAQQAQGAMRGVGA